jgi:hypothetical protein
MFLLATTAYAIAVIADPYRDVSVNFSDDLYALYAFRLPALAATHDDWSSNKCNTPVRRSNTTSCDTYTALAKCRDLLKVL